MISSRPTLGLAASRSAGLAGGGALLLLSGLAATGCSDEAATAALGVACAADVDCAALDDGDPCTGVIRCGEGGRCALDVVAVPTCSDADDGPCLRSACHPATGQCAQVPRADGLGCDDGDPCSAGDRCVAGACAAGPVSVCPCLEDADCPDPDGDRCTGVPYCDRTRQPFQCRPNPGSAVDCGPADGPCLVRACDPKTGGCLDEPVPDGGPCEDGSDCTANDRCVSGSCQPGTEICKCASDADCKDDDDDPCTGVPYCHKEASGAVCKVNPATVVHCSPAQDTACRKSVCQPATATCALVPVNAGLPCDDGEACTVGEVCQGGACLGGTDTCACTADADCAAQEDGDLCNGTLYCHLASGKCLTNPKTVIHCQTGEDTACAKNVCSAKTGACALMPRADVKLLGCQAIELGQGVVVQHCAFAAKQPGEPADAGPFGCEDGDPCTVGDACAATSCASGAKVCACSADADCEDDEDGDLCNGTLYCDKTLGACVLNPATAVTCPTADDTACMKSRCAPKTGVCLPQPVTPGTACDDGDLCTKGDACKLGACQPGVFVCACQVDADCVDADGDACTGVPYCDKSGPLPACLHNPASVVVCTPKDDTACVKASCDPKTGACALAALPPGAPCDDLNPCTAKSACQGAACVGTQAAPCDDGDACTVDACLAGVGCSHQPKDCDDGNACTVDQCAAGAGTCANAPRPAGASCNADQDGCTVGDACDGASVCLAGVKAKCAASAGPCEQSACQSKGADGFACAVVARPDGATCPDADPCWAGASCSAGECKPGTASTLWRYEPEVAGPMTFEVGAFPAAPFKGAAGDGHGALVLAGRDGSAAGKGSWQVHQGDRKNATG